MHKCLASFSNEIFKYYPFQYICSKIIQPTQNQLNINLIISNNLKLLSANINKSKIG